MSELVKSEKKVVSGVTIENVVYDSSNVLKTSYNYTTNRLIITFKKGGAYQYFDIPVKVYEGFKTTDSIGKYIHSIIKKFVCMKMGEANQETLGVLLKEVDSHREKKESENPSK